MEIIYDLWETGTPTQHRVQHKISGIGYSSVFLTNEEKKHPSYQLWKNMIHLCYNNVSETIKRKRKGKSFECCNSWLDYQKFYKWFNKNYVGADVYTPFLTKCIISKDNLIFNPNNCAIVPKDIYMYLEYEKANKKKATYLANKYEQYLTDDVYELLTEDFNG